MNYKNACSVGVGIVMWPFFVLADNIEKYNCESPQNGLEIFKCSKHNFEEADNMLNKNYRLLMGRIRSQYKKDEPLGEKYLNSVKQSQLAWIKLRDENCPLEAFEIEAGSQAYEVVMNDCLARMSNERSHYLSEISPVFP